MKVAVSVPGPIFDEAEVLCGRLGISRSKLYAQALEQYVKTHGKSAVREALDALYSTEDSAMDPTLDAAQAEALREDW